VLAQKRGGGNQSWLSFGALTHRSSPKLVHTSESPKNRWADGGYLGGTGSFGSFCFLKFQSKKDEFYDRNQSIKFFQGTNFGTFMTR
jgi:hypothetical protein